MRGASARFAPRVGEQVRALVRQTDTAPTQKARRRVNTLVFRKSQEVLDAAYSEHLHSIHRRVEQRPTLMERVTASRPQLKKQQGRAGGRGEGEGGGGGTLPPRVPFAPTDHYTFRQGDFDDGHFEDVLESSVSSSLSSLSLSHSPRSPHDLHRNPYLEGLSAADLSSTSTSTSTSTPLSSSSSSATTSMAATPRRHHSQRHTASHVEQRQQQQQQEEEEEGQGAGSGFGFGECRVREGMPHRGTQRALDFRQTGAAAPLHSAGRGRGAVVQGRRAWGRGSSTADALSGGDFVVVRDRNASESSDDSDGADLTHQHASHSHGVSAAPGGGGRWGDAGTRVAWRDVVDDVPDADVTVEFSR